MRRVINIFALILLSSGIGLVANDHVRDKPEKEQPWIGPVDNSVHAPYNMPDTYLPSWVKFHQDRSDLHK